MFKKEKHQKELVNVKLHIKQKSEKNAEIINSIQVMTGTVIHTYYIIRIKQYILEWRNYWNGIWTVIFPSKWTNSDNSVSTFLCKSRKFKQVMFFVKDYHQCNTSTSSSTLGLAMEATKWAWNLDSFDVSYIPDGKLLYKIKKIIIKLLVNIHIQGIFIFVFTT